MSQGQIQLTKNQFIVLEVLKANPEKWMNAREINAILYPNDVEVNAQRIGSIGASLKRLPLKTECVFAMPDFGFTRYKYSAVGNNALSVDSAFVTVSAPRITDSAPDGQLPQPKAFTKSSMAGVNTTDTQLISDALMYYSNGMVKTNPTRALRAAYLAGKMVADAGYYETPMVAEKHPKRVTALYQGPRMDIDKTESDDDCANTIIEPPPDMTYDDFVEFAKDCNANWSMDFESVAKRCGMDEQYVRKIIRGDATPRKDTWVRVYSAILSDAD